MPSPLYPLSLKQPCKWQHYLPKNIQDQLPLPTVHFLQQQESPLHLSASSPLHLTQSTISGGGLPLSHNQATLLSALNLCSPPPVRDAFHPPL